MTLPLGISDVISIQLELEPLMNTLCWLFDKKSFIQLSSYPFILFFSNCSSVWYLVKPFTEIKINDIHILPIVHSFCLLCLPGIQVIVLH